MKKVDEAIMQCYRELYLKATPSANFDELPIFDKSSRFFMDYVLSEKEQSEIIDKVMKDFKIPSYKRGAFRMTIFLGCAPKFN